jgi:DNA-binding IclR family transcriptional regulator
LIPEAESDPARRPQAAARVTRQLRLLCAHGLIYRVGRTYYYRLTQKGYEVMSTALKFRQTDLALLAA